MSQARKHGRGIDETLDSTLPLLFATLHSTARGKGVLTYSHTITPQEGNLAIHNETPQHAHANN